MSTNELYAIATRWLICDQSTNDNESLIIDDLDERLYIMKTINRDFIKFIDRFERSENTIENNTTRIMYHMINLETLNKAVIDSISECFIGTICNNIVDLFKNSLLHEVNSENEFIKVIHNELSWFITEKYRDAIWNKDYLFETVMMYLLYDSYIREIAGKDRDLINIHHINPNIINNKPLVISMIENRTIKVTFETLKWAIVNKYTWLIHHLVDRIDSFTCPETIGLFVMVKSYPIIQSIILNKIREESIYIGYGTFMYAVRQNDKWSIDLHMRLLPELYKICILKWIVTEISTNYNYNLGMIFKRILRKIVISQNIYEEISSSIDNFTYIHQILENNANVDSTDDSINCKCKKCVKLKNIYINPRSRLNQYMLIECVDSLYNNIYD